tara:strand:+ start:528 stop:1145 length:618 start_codon:yes stop_codon:yes gene_type:complete
MITDPLATDYPQINNFLLCPTPNEWLAMVPRQLNTLLIDHALCELKAANTALRLIFNYPRHHRLCVELSKLAREELLHFEKVMEILIDRGIGFKHLSASRYASSLIKHARAHEPEKAVDILIIGGIIEARSCERFLAMLPYLDEELKLFYKTLVRSEARHFLTYLDFAKALSDTDISERVQTLLSEEKKLIQSADHPFRFHSGKP